MIPYLTNRILYIILIIFCLTLILFLLVSIPLQYPHSSDALLSPVKESSVTREEYKPVPTLDIKQLIEQHDIFGDNKELSKEPTPLEDKPATSKEVNEKPTAKNEAEPEKPKENKIDPNHSVLQEDKLDHYDYCQADIPDRFLYKPITDHELLSVHVMTRHGDRTPTKFLPLGLETTSWDCDLESHHLLNKDNNLHRQKIFHLPEGCTGDSEYCYVNPFKPLYWPGSCIAGQLTPKGILQHLRLGKRLKEIYIGRLGLLTGSMENDSKHLLLRSTDIKRTQQSANALISGMYPQTSSNITTVKVFSLPMALDTLLPQQGSCPLLKKLERELLNSQKYKEFLSSTEHHRTQFESIIGGPRLGDDPDRIDYYVDIFMARQCHNLPKVCKREKKGNPEAKNTTTESCVTKELIDQMMVYGNTETRLFFRDHPSIFPKLARLRIGGFLLEFKRNILMAISDHSNQPLYHKVGEALNFIGGMDGSILPKFLLYSAHDTSIAAVLGALHSDNMNWPPYASNLIFELWANKTQPFNIQDPLERYQLRMIYNGAELKTSWCKTGSCSTKTFLQYLDDTLGIIGGFEGYFISKVENKKTNDTKDDVKHNNNNTEKAPLSDTGKGNITQTKEINNTTKGGAKDFLDPTIPDSKISNGSKVKRSPTKDTLPLIDPKRKPWDFLVECWL